MAYRLHLLATPRSEVMYNRALIRLQLVACILSIGAMGMGCSGSRVPSPQVATPANCLVAQLDEGVPNEARIIVERNYQSGNWTSALQPAYSDQLIAPLLFETLFEIDCNGQVRNRLAARSFGNRSNRGLTIILKDGVTFSSGNAVTAYAVVESWQETLASITAVDSIAALGPDTILVFSDLSESGLQKLLADPVFAIFGKRKADVVGTTSYNRRSSAGETGIAKLTTADSTRTGTVIFDTSLGDVRDLLPGSASGVLTSDPDVIEYFSTSPGVNTIDLGPSATYVLLSTSRLDWLADAGNASRDTVFNIESSFRHELANTAVRATSVGYPSNRLVGFPAHCEIGQLTAESAESNSAATANRIVFDVKDPTARDLAERLVGLLSSFPGQDQSDKVTLVESLFPTFKIGDPIPISVGLPRNELRSSLSEKSDIGYVLRLDGSVLSQCLNLQSLSDSTPWLQEGFSMTQLFAAPLIQLQYSLVLADGTVGVSMDGQRRVHLEPDRKEVVE